MTRQDNTRTITRTLRKAAEAFIRRKTESAAGHRFEIMPAYLLTNLNVIPDPSVEGCRVV